MAVTPGGELGSGQAFLALSRGRARTEGGGAFDAGGVGDIAGAGENDDDEGEKEHAY